VCEREINNDSVFVPLGKDALLRMRYSQFGAFVLNHIVFSSLPWAHIRSDSLLNHAAGTKQPDRVCVCVF